MTLDRHVAHAGDLGEHAWCDRGRELQLDLVMGKVTERFDAIHLDDAAFPDDRHAIAGLLDLAEDVAREEGCSALADGLAQELEERLLDERVEPGGGLIEHEQVGSVLEGDDEPDLLLVALRVLLEGAARVEVESGDEVRLVGRIDAAAEVGEVVDRLSARQPVVQGELPGQVADATVDRDWVDGRLDTEDAGMPLCRSNQVEQDPDRRGLARAVRPKKAEDLTPLDVEIDVDDPAMRAVGLGQPLGFDDGRHCTPPWECEPT